MKQRAFTIFKYAISILVIGILYGIFVMNTGYGIPCMFRLVTGYQCPGCGISRMCMALMKLDFKAAYQYNPLLFLISPVLIIVFAYQIYRYIRYDETKSTKVQSAINIIVVALLILWGFVRNMSFLSI
ncbi:MAG: DUF2752 domain-containing protein [Lachnospiraceae bacterium]|nr:DUF2752 domain-containing protein [Lachnospiraceae bacterium]